MSSERHWREQLGAYALGHLDEAARAALDAHLDVCAACRAELEELLPVAAALPGADPDRLVAGPAAPAHLGAQVFARIRAAGQERHRARQRRWAVAAAAALVVTLMVVGGLALRPSAPEGLPVVFDAPSGVEAEAVLYDWDWGVSVALEAEGLRGGELYTVWVERADGTRLPAGTFLGVEGRRIRCRMAAGVVLADAAAVGVSDPDGRTILHAPLPPPPREGVSTS